MQHITAVVTFLRSYGIGPPKFGSIYATSSLVSTRSYPILTVISDWVVRDVLDPLCPSVLDQSAGTLLRIVSLLEESGWNEPSADHFADCGNYR